MIDHKVKEVSIYKASLKFPEKIKINWYEENHLTVSPDISQFKRCFLGSLTLFFPPNYNLHGGCLSKTFGNKTTASWKNCFCFFELLFITISPFFS